MTQELSHDVIVAELKHKLNDEEKKVRQAAYFKKHYEKNREAILIKLRHRYHEEKDGQESLKAKQSKYYKEYYVLHRDEILARARNYALKKKKG